MRISDWSSDVCSSDLHPRLAADAGGVDQAVLAAVAFEVDRDRVARGAGDFRGDHPLLAKDAVDQGRLAHVRAANEGYAHALRVVVEALRVSIGRYRGHAPGQQPLDAVTVSRGGAANMGEPAR